MTDAEFNICVEKYMKMVYRIAFRYFGRREDAEDITQDVFMKLYSSNITRENDECPEISLFIEPVMESVDYSSFGESRDVLGTTVYYSRDTYKFVPADYELTEEDQKNMEQPNHYISYGSDKVEVQTCDNVIFEMDGKRYTLLGFDNDMTADEWYDMAGDLIQK